MLVPASCSSFIKAVHRNKDDADEEEAALQPVLSLQALENSVSPLVSSATIHVEDGSFQIFLGCNEGKLAFLDKLMIEVAYAASWMGGPSFAEHFFPSLAPLADSCSRKL